MQNRRQFISFLGRSLIFGGVVALSGYLLLREESKTADPCDFDFTCSQCKRLKNCNLPEARTFKTQNGQQSANPN